MRMTSLQIPVLAIAFLSLPGWAAGLDAPGVPNFHQVDQNIYRGGQPDDQAWAGLAKLGVKLVLDLRRPDEHSTVNEKKLVEAAGMRYVNLPLKGVVAPRSEDVAQALALLEASEKAPVFVHCKRGADRTGAVVACYRISHDKWQNHQAMTEAKSLGMSPFQVGIKSYVKNYREPVESAAAAPALAAGGTAEQQPVALRP